MADLLPPPPSIEDEFYLSECKVRDMFKRFLVHDPEGKDVEVHLHSNGVCYLTLAPTHPVLNPLVEVTGVEFTAQRLSTQVSGKKKRGSQALHPNSHLCTIRTSDEQEHAVRCAVEGKLVEVNRRLLEAPQEVRSATKGYLAVFMTKWVDAVDAPSPPESWVRLEDRA